jgi:hypothetical protein
VRLMLLSGTDLVQSFLTPGLWSDQDVRGPPSPLSRYAHKYTPSLRWWPIPFVSLIHARVWSHTTLVLCVCVYVSLSLSHTHLPLYLSLSLSHSVCVQVDAIVGQHGLVAIERFGVSSAEVVAAHPVLGPYRERSLWLVPQPVLNDVSSTKMRCASGDAPTLPRVDR